MTITGHSSYVALMKAHCSAYRTDVLNLADCGEWRMSDRRSVPVEHILPAAFARHNIISSHRESFWAWYDAQATIGNAPSLHKHFSHLTSSQAFAFNLFFPFLTGSDNARRVLLLALGLPELAIERWAFEHVLDTSERTNFDVVLWLADRSIVLIEVKLTENGFAGATHSRLRTPKLVRYRERLSSVLRSEALGDDFLLENYQLCRNLSYLSLPNTLVAVLSPGANAATAKELNTVRDVVLPGAADRLYVPAIENVLNRLTIEAAAAYEPALIEAVGELRKKYLP
jgi:hypothetical protein